MMMTLQNNMVESKKRMTIVSKRKMGLSQSNDYSIVLPATQSQTELELHNEQTTFTRTILNSLEQSQILDQLDDCSNDQYAIEKKRNIIEFIPIAAAESPAHIKCTGPKCSTSDSKKLPCQIIPLPEKLNIRTHAQIKQQKSSVVFSNALLNKSLIKFTSVGVAHLDRSFLKNKGEENLKEDLNNQPSSIATAHTAKKHYSMIKLEDFFSKSKRTPTIELKNEALFEQNVVKNQVPKRVQQPSYFFKLPQKKQQPFFNDKSIVVMLDKNNNFLLRQASLVNFMRNASKEQLKPQAQQQKTQLINNLETITYDSEIKIRDVRQFPLQRNTQQVYSNRRISPALFSRNEVCLSGKEQGKLTNLTGNTTPTISQNSVNTSPFQKRQVITRIVRCRNQKRSNKDSSTFTSPTKSNTLIDEGDDTHSYNNDYKNNEVPTQTEIKTWQLTHSRKDVLNKMAKNQSKSLTNYKSNI